MSSIALCRCAEINAKCQENPVIFDWLYRQPILLYKHTKKRNRIILVVFCLFIRKKRMTSNKVDNTMIQSVHLMYIKSKTVKFEVFGGIYSTAQSGLTYLCHVTQITWRTSQCRIHPQISEQTTFVFLLFFLLSPIFIFLQIKNEKNINYLIKARNWI